MIQLFSTLSNRLEPLEPLEKGKIKMYVCGPTVYDDAHIGHARVYVVYDVIVRYLRSRGFDLCYARNITDIDDKIIKRANEAGVPFREWAERYTDSFNDDLSRLGLLPPNHTPKASETIPEMIAMIEKLIASGKAYPSKGDVYFSISKFSEYGKLSKKNLEDLQVGARVEPGEQKKEPLDFALWKASKPNEPFWPSPWGNGRPGWHIECSAMVAKLLGDSIDIHAGGRDLIFPHHENEIAQSEGATGKMFSKYWLHNGFLNIDQEKMSKSLGNIVTIKSLLARFHPEAIKLYLLSTHYRAPMDFSDSGIQECSHALDRIYRVLLSIPSEKEQPDPGMIQKFESIMDNDFNTAQAIALIFDAVKEANRLQQKAEGLADAVKLRATIVLIGNRMGLLQDDPHQYFQRSSAASKVDRLKVEQLIADRAQARRKKDFSRADQIRQELKEMNVVVEDGAEGTTWRVTT